MVTKKLKRYKAIVQMKMGGIVKFLNLKSDKIASVRARNITEARRKVRGIITKTKKDLGTLAPTVKMTVKSLKQVK